jgi:hypothetical protein
MIRGYFAYDRGRSRPFFDGTLSFPRLERRRVALPFLIDTGADRTVLSSIDALFLGSALASFGPGPGIGGIGGRAPTLITDATLSLGQFSASLILTIPLPDPAVPPIPTILGRDILSRFALFLEERTGRVLLLEPEEADRLDLA